MRLIDFKLVAELKFPDFASAAVKRRVGREETHPCYDLAFHNAKVYACSRDKNHEGRHHEGDDTIVIAVWRDQ